MHVLHTSDLHGAYKELLTALQTSTFDLWIDSGDFLPNKVWGQGLGNPDVEIPYQSKWLGWKGLPTKIRESMQANPNLKLGARTPVVMVPGNHDYIDLASVLSRYGLDAHRVRSSPLSVTTQAGAVSIQGFRQVPLCGHPFGAWSGETEAEAFPALLDRLRADVGAGRPDLLVTHAPACDVLDDPADKGVPGLKAHIDQSTYTAHLHGHVHVAGGQTCDWHRADGGPVRSINGAKKCIVHEIQLWSSNETL